MTTRALVCLVPALFAMAEGPEKKALPPLPEELVDLKMEFRNGASPRLDISITNKGAKEIRIVKLWLPWNSRFSMNLLLIRADGSMDQLKDSWEGRIDDPARLFETLKPNQTVKGQIDLQKRFPGFQDAISVNGIDVFWSYRPRDFDRTPLKRTGGWLYIPKSK